MVPATPAPRAAVLPAIPDHPVVRVAAAIMAAGIVVVVTVVVAAMAAAAEAVAGAVGIDGVRSHFELGSGSWEISPPTNL